MTDNPGARTSTGPAEPLTIRPPKHLRSGRQEDRQSVPGPERQPGREQVLARFIRLCGDVIGTPDHREAAALAVNRVSELVQTDRAVLIRLTGKQPIAAVTGGGAAAQDSAFADAVSEVRARYGDGGQTVALPRIAESDRRVSPHLWAVQQAMGGTSILWLPLWPTRDDSVAPTHALWLERWQGRKWERGDIELLQHAALFLAQGISMRRPAPAKRRGVRWLAALAVILAVMLFPVTASITATGHVVPDQPRHIFAPMDGILKELHVKPGQWVDEGDLLFRYDARVLDKRLDEAYRNVAVAKAKLVRLQGAAHRDADARAEIPVQELEVERAEADARFYEVMRGKADVRSDTAGVVILDDPEQLIGAALQTGQAVMRVADPAKTKLRMMVSTGDAGMVRKGAPVTLRPDSAPLTRCSGLVTRVGFEVQVTETQIPGILVEAMWVGDPPDLQPGQRGTAKVFGGTTILGMQILRKPLIALRRYVGL